jgi:hypothetical protein
VQSSRLRSYALMTLGALACGVLGAAFDQLTVTLSPAYFTLGKGVSTEAPLRWSAAIVGFRGGLPLGALLVGVLLWCRERAHGVRALSVLLSAACAAVVAALACALALSAFDPFRVRVESQGVLTAGAADRYLACWGMHIGAYAGPLLSVAVTMLHAAKPWRLHDHACSQR